MFHEALERLRNGFRGKQFRANSFFFSNLRFGLADNSASDDAEPSANPTRRATVKGKNVMKLTATKIISRALQRFVKR